MFDNIFNAVLVIVGVILALLVPLYVVKAKALKKKLDAFGAWVTRNRYFWVIFLIIVAVLVLAMVTPSKNDAERVDKQRSVLSFMLSNDYQAEIDQYADSVKIPDWKAEKRVLIMIFEFAVRYWEQGENEEARDALISLENGKDAHGRFPQIRSSVVANNLGCVTFEIEGNKRFKAYDYLAEARRRAGKDGPYSGKVEMNIQKLDSMVNW